MGHEFPGLFDCRVPSWMEQAGPEGDIVLSSRIRLARNLSGVPFPGQADEKQLAGIGQGGIGQAIGAAGQTTTASMIPQELYNKYASVIFGTPAASYTSNAPYGSSKTGFDIGAKI